MSRPRRIEGFAIVSADGMIANADAMMPDELKYAADQRFFHGELRRVQAVTHGADSHEGGAHAADRQRIILTRRIATIAPDADNAKAVLWNPAGASFEAAWAALGIPNGVLAMIGGTDVFGLFLSIGYDAFHLSRSPPHVRLPGGRPVFPQVARGRSPEEVLADHGLKPGPRRVLDAGAGVSVVTWQR